MTPGGCREHADYAYQRVLEACQCILNEVEVLDMVEAGEIPRQGNIKNKLKQRSGTVLKHCDARNLQDALLELLKQACIQQQGWVQDWHAADLQTSPRVGITDSELLPA